jgi:hypothetical protein
MSQPLLSLPSSYADPMACGTLQAICGIRICIQSGASIPVKLKKAGEQVAYFEEDQSMRALGIGLIGIRSGFEQCLDAAVITRCHSLEQRVRCGIDRSSWLGHVYQAVRIIVNIVERDISKKGVKIALADSFPTARGRGAAPLSQSAFFIALVCSKRSLVQNMSRFDEQVNAQVIAIRSSKPDFSATGYHAFHNLHYVECAGTFDAISILGPTKCSSFDNVITHQENYHEISTDHQRSGR